MLKLQSQSQCWSTIRSSCQSASSPSAGPLGHSPCLVVNGFSWGEHVWRLHPCRALGHAFFLVFFFQASLPCSFFHSFISSTSYFSVFIFILLFRSTPPILFCPFLSSHGARTYFFYFASSGFLSTHCALTRSPTRGDEAAQIENEYGELVPDPTTVLTCRC